MHYRAEIDGFRALAVIPVILFHAGFETFSGGYVGVDVFFVISGYLITSIISSEMDNGNFSLIRFYERRARRILPSLFFIMIVCIPFVWLWMMPRYMEDFAQSLVAVSTFSSNILFWRESGYFETAAELKPLLHTWSLAVEEQYYILFPLFLMLTWRFGKRWILITLIAIAVLSFGLALFNTYYKLGTSFYLLPARGWEILLGSFVAFYLNRKQPAGTHHLVNQGLSFIGLVLIIYSIFVFDRQTPFPSIYTLIPTIGAVLIIVFCQSTTFVYQLLSNRLLVGVGLISYSAYLWHQPLLAFAKYRSSTEPPFIVVGLLCLATFALAYLSWRYIEKPFRHRNKFSQRTIFTFGAITSIALISFGIIGSISHGFEKYYFEHRLTQSEAHNYKLIKKHTDYNIYDYMVDDGECNFWNRKDSTLGRSSANQIIRFWLKSYTVTPETIERFDSCYERFGKAVIVLGDSHALNLYNIAAKSNVYPFVIGIAAGGCRPQNNLPYCHYDNFDEFLKRYHDKIKLILFHQSGAYFVEDANGNVDSSLAFADGQRYTFNESSIDFILRYVDKLNRYSKTLWVGPFIETRAYFLERRTMDPAWIKTINSRYSLNPNSITVFSELEHFIQDRIALSESFTNERYIPFNEIFDITLNFLFVGDCLTYMNMDHFSRCGEDLIAKHFASAMINYQ